jgi:hypothetical protein
MDIWTNFELCLDAGRERERAQKRQIAEERERVEAMKIVLSAVVDSTGWFGLNRRKFKKIMLAAAKETPNVGPQAARHEIFLAQSSKVLGVNGVRSQTPPSPPGSPSGRDRTRRRRPGR